MWVVVSMSLEATIKISQETRAALNALKRGGETQDAVIRRLICFHVKPIFDELEEWMKPLIAPILGGELHE